MVKELIKNDQNRQQVKLYSLKMQRLNIVHIPVVMVSFGIFKLRDLILVKDCYKKT
jgi:hypothetical protein